MSMKKNDTKSILLLKQKIQKDPKKFYLKTSSTVTSQLCLLIFVSVSTCDRLLFRIFQTESMQNLLIGYMVSIWSIKDAVRLVVALRGVESRIQKKINFNRTLSTCHEQNEAQSRAFFWLNMYATPIIQPSFEFLFVCFEKMLPNAIDSIYIYFIVHEHLFF